MFLKKLAPLVGAVGLAIDLFHWAATPDRSDVPSVMTTLLVDTDRRKTPGG